MNMIISLLFSLSAVSILVLIPLVGVWALDMRILFGVVIPYAALLIFVLGIVARVIDWARSPVPFRIPTHLFDCPEGYNRRTDMLGDCSRFLIHHR